MNTWDLDDCNTLMWAAVNGRVKCMELLIQAGSDVNEQDEYGNAALMMASHHCSDKCVQLLLKKEADVKKKNKNE